MDVNHWFYFSNEWFDIWSCFKENTPFDFNLLNFTIIFHVSSCANLLYLFSFPGQGVVRTGTQLRIQSRRVWLLHLLEERGKGEQTGFMLAENYVKKKEFDHYD